MLRQDYIMRMIAQLTDSVSEALNKSSLGLELDAQTELEEAIGMALEMSPETVFALSPESLATMVQISNMDESVAVYVVYALEKLSEIMKQEGNPDAKLRFQQAEAIAQFYGFSLGQEPEGISNNSK